MGVAPRGNDFTCPWGVKQYTSSGYRSTLTMFRNSRGSLSSCCHSMICRSHWMLASCSLAPFPSLYFQCAAIPSSAMRCMSWVRIWTSNGWPLSVMTEVCRDWYMFGLGMAMKSLMRPGTGRHSPWMIPRAP